MEENPDYYYCPECGFRMMDKEYCSIIVDVRCPGRGGKPCGGRPISMFYSGYFEKEDGE